MVCDQLAFGDCLARKLDGVTITFYGDKRLDKDPRQELYLTMLLAQSILDVLEAGRTHDATKSNNFGKLGYSAALPTNQRRLKVVPLWQQPTAFTPYGAFATETAWGIPRRDRTFSLSSSVQTFPGATNRFGDERLRMGLDMQIFAWPGDWMDSPRTRFRNQILVAVGADIVNDPGGSPNSHQWFHGAGYTARATIPVSAINTQFTATYGNRYYGLGAGGHDWGSHAGGRVEFGFGLAWLGLGFESEHYVDFNQRRLRAARALSPSIMLTLPGSVTFPRVPGWFKH